MKIIIEFKNNIKTNFNQTANIDRLMTKTILYIYIYISFIYKLFFLWKVN